MALNVHECFVSENSLQSFFFFFFYILLSSSYCWLLVNILITVWFNKTYNKIKKLCGHGFFLKISSNTPVPIPGCNPPPQHTHTHTHSCLSMAAERPGTNMSHSQSHISPHVQEDLSQAKGVVERGGLYAYRCMPCVSEFSNSSQTRRDIF